MVFDPHDPAPVRPPSNVTRMGAPDVRHAVGNISARIRRAGTPESVAEWARLLAAPTGR